jgi:hypothetical protein
MIMDTKLSSLNITVELEVKLKHFGESEEIFWNLVEQIWNVQE